MIRSLSDFPEIGEIPETGTTLEENAFIKARAGFTQTGLPTIADDTGLEVDALKGAPGVFAARYAGKHASYEDNVTKLLAALEKVPQGKRTARFVTAAVFVDAGHEIVARGEVSGEITRHRIGAEGFGYDPVFFVPERGKTYAQMSLAEKNRLSHRQRAFHRLMEILVDQHAAFRTEQPIR